VISLEQCVVRSYCAAERFSLPVPPQDQTKQTVDVERKVQQTHYRVLGHSFGCVVALSGCFAGAPASTEMSM